MTSPGKIRLRDSQDSVSTLSETTPSEDSENYLRHDLEADSSNNQIELEGDDDDDADEEAGSESESEGESESEDDAFEVVSFNF